MYDDTFASIKRKQLKNKDVVEEHKVKNLFVNINDFKGPEIKESPKNKNQSDLMHFESKISNNDKMNLNNEDNFHLFASISK